MSWGAPAASVRPIILPGDIVTGAQWDTILTEIQRRGMAAYGNRPSNSTGFTGEIGVLRLPGIPVFANRIYRIYTNSIRLFSTVASDDVTAAIRYTTDGSTPSVTSTLLTLATEKVSGASVDRGGTVSPGGVYVPSTDQTLSVLLSGLRQNGTGTCNLLATIELYIEDLGTTPTDTGVDL